MSKHERPDGVAPDKVLVPIDLDVDETPADEPRAAMFTAKFWTETFERACKTIGQALLSMWVVGGITPNLLTVDWRNALGVAVTAAVLSVVTSIVSLPIGESGSPNLLR